MWKFLQKVSVLSFLAIIFVSRVDAQGWCTSATVYCQEQGTFDECDGGANDGNSCSGDIDCFPGGTCEEVPAIVDDWHESCSYISHDSSCRGSCPPGIQQFGTCPDPPPSGGYGCVNGSCQWTSSGGGCASCAPSECGDGVTDLGEDCDAGPGGSSTCDTSCHTIVGQTCNWCTNQAQCLAVNGTWSGPSNYCAVSGDGCCEGGPGFESSCQPTANICETGVGIAGANGTGCNSEMISYRNSAGQVTLAALKTDGSACPNVWGGRTDSGDTFGGLAVWKQTSDTVSGNDLLRPNYGYYNADNPEIITKNLLTLINNDDYKVSIDIGLASPSTSSAYLLNPACATNAGTNGFHRPYVFNDTQYRDQDDNIEAEKRWKAMRACYSKVVYEPIDCVVSSNKDTVVVGEEITISLFAGNRRPVHIDGSDVPSPGYTARLFLEKTDFSEISPLPASLSYTNGQPGNRYYYQLSAASCTFDATSGKCNSTFQTSDLPAGSYKFHCDIPSVGAFEPQKCSGNPWCSFEGGGESNICPDWISCSENDKLNVVVIDEVPPAPTGLVSSCVAPGDRMTLSWDPVAGADSYLVRVDDGISGDGVEAILYVGVDTCPEEHPSWDVCVQTTATSLQVRVDPATFTAASWSVYAINAAGESVSSEYQVLNSCIPNCYNISGDLEIPQGTTANYSADFVSNYGSLRTMISQGQGGAWISDWNDITYCSGTECNPGQVVNKSYSWDTTGVPVGTYDIFCRSWNDGIAECRGKSNYVDGPPRYDCPSNGPGVTTLSVEVVPPEIKITGTVYEGLGNGMSGNYCAAGGGTAWSQGGSMSVSVSGLSPNPSSGAVSGSDGTYQTGVFEPDTGTGGEIALNTIPDGYSPICPVGGAYSGVDTTGLADDIENVHFYISALKEPWWQTRSGLAYGSVLTSNLPYDTNADLDPLCLAYASCVPFLVSGSLGDTDPNLSAGIPISILINGTDDYNSQHKNAAGDYFDSANHSDAGLAKENYAVLSRRFDLAAATTITSPLSNAIPPAGDPGQGTDFTEVYKRIGDLEITPSATWVVAGKKVIFVDGNVTINGPADNKIISVDPGGFFAIIATGDITIDQDIGASISYGGTPTIEPQIEGFYVADGSLIIEESGDQDAIDKMFIGAGSFVGWEGVRLPRDFETVADPSTGLLNNYVPTDTFIFRPDFILNTPELMKRSTFNWREINSITQD